MEIEVIVKDNIIQNKSTFFFSLINFCRYSYISLNIFNTHKVRRGNAVNILSFLIFIGINIAIIQKNIPESPLILPILSNMIIFL